MAAESGAAALKAKGNELFKKGRWLAAAQMYTDAIVSAACGS